MTTEHTRLGSALRLRGVELKNRVMVSPMCMYRAEEGNLNDFHLAHLGRFAMGGAGLVFVEATAVSRQGRITAGCAALWNDGQVEGLRRVAALVHDLGAAVGIQLSHSGRKGSSERPWHGLGALAGSAGPDATQAWQTVGPTGEPAGKTWPAPLPLDEAGITEIVADFAAAARRADQAGVDVLELHCAHGYLLHQFLSPLCNTREDEYGGSLEGRMRFPLRVARAIREVWPERKPLFVRVSAVDGIDVGWTIDDTLVFAAALRDCGADVMDCSSGGMKLPRDKILVGREPGFHVPFAQRIRRETGLPTVAVGLIRDPQLAFAILRRGQADLIAIAREALFDANWAHRALLAEEGEQGWARWPEEHGYWLKHRATQQSDTYEHLARVLPKRSEPATH